ncbi:hypothetical protein DMH88_10125 [Escherichia coli]|nr:hypothetical protein [Escherichia coli]
MIAVALKKIELFIGFRTNYLPQIILGDSINLGGINRFSYKKILGGKIFCMLSINIDKNNNHDY